MGHGIYANAPISAEGRYFRCSVWEWPPLLSLTADLCP